jgi:hypothetical protein
MAAKPVFLRTEGDIYYEVTPETLEDTIREIRRGKGKSIGMIMHSIPPISNAKAQNMIKRAREMKTAVFGATKGANGKLDTRLAFTLTTEDTRLIATMGDKAIIGSNRAQILRQFGVQRVHTTTKEKGIIRSNAGIIKIDRFSTRKMGELYRADQRMLVHATVRIRYSAEEEKRNLPTFQTTYMKLYDDLATYMNNYVKGEYDVKLDAIKIIPKDYVAPSFPTVHTLPPAKDSKIKNGNVRDISHLFGEEIDLNESDTNCVYNAICKKFTTGKDKISERSIERKYGRDDWNLVKLQRFCNEYLVKFRAFNLQGVLVCDNDTVLDDNYTHTQGIDDNEFKKYKRTLNCIVYDNHLYVLKNKYLSKIDRNLKKFEQVSRDQLVGLIMKKEPTHVTMGVNGISEVTIGDTLYHHDTSCELRDVHEILQRYGLADKMTHRTKYSTAVRMIEKLYGFNVDSFLPLNHNLKSGFTYGKCTGFNETSFDMNNCYPSCLEELPYLIKTNYAYNHASVYENQPIVDHYLYSVTPAMSSILMPNTSIYAGYHIKYCQSEGIEFTINEVIETEIAPNFYTHILEESRRLLTRPQYKCLWNRAIGLMNHRDDATNSERFVFSHTANLEEALRWKDLDVDNYIEQIQCNGAEMTVSDDDDIEIVSGSTREQRFICYKKIIRCPSYSNKSPIYIQVLDRSRVRLYEKMKQIVERFDCNVVQIKTDCFTVDKELFHEKTGDLLPELSISDVHSDGGRYVVPPESKEDIVGEGWKIIKCTSSKFENDVYDSPCSFFQTPINSNNTLYNCYAGVGKSYHIQTQTIPKLDDYIVLCPTHSSLVDYKNKVFNRDLTKTRREFNLDTGMYDEITESANINCDIIHKYTFANQIPREKTVIIDEIGLITQYDYIWALAQQGKQLLAFGDYNQLLPIGSYRPYNAPQFIQAIFGKIDTDTLKINRRNDFSFDFYDRMIADECDSSKIIRQFCKIDLGDYQPTDICIARTNAECDQINGDILEMLFETREMCVGSKIECRSNLLRDRDIFNHYQFEIMSMNDDEVILSDETREVAITPRQLRNNFTPAYCVTLHSAQGKSYPVVRYLSDNLDLSGRELYTLISRIKTK